MIRPGTRKASIVAQRVLLYPKQEYTEPMQRTFGGKHEINIFKNCRCCIFDSDLSFIAMLLSIELLDDKFGVVNSGFS